MKKIDLMGNEKLQAQVLAYSRMAQQLDMPGNRVLTQAGLEAIRARAQLIQQEIETLPRESDLDRRSSLSAELVQLSDILAKSENFETMPIELLIDVGQLNNSIIDFCARLQIEAHSIENAVRVDLLAFLRSNNCDPELEPVATGVISGHNAQLTDLKNTFDEFLKSSPSRILFDIRMIRSFAEQNPRYFALFMSALSLESLDVSGYTALVTSAIVNKVFNLENNLDEITTLNAPIVILPQGDTSGFTL